MDPEPKVLLLPKEFLEAFFFLSSNCGLLKEICKQSVFTSSPGDSVEHWPSMMTAITIRLLNYSARTGVSLEKSCEGMFRKIRVSGFLSNIFTHSADLVCALLCLHTGASCSPRGSTQQLTQIETDLDVSCSLLWKNRRRNLGYRRV